MADALRWLWTDMRHLGVVDAKWALIAFVVTAIVAFYWRSAQLARLERENGFLRLLAEAEAANTELRRLGSKVRVDTSTLEI